VSFLKTRTKSIVKLFLLFSIIFVLLSVFLSSNAFLCEAIPNKDLLSYHVASSDPETKKYVEYEFGITDLNTSGIFANFTRKNTTGDLEIVQDYKIGHVLSGEKEMQDFEQFWEDLLSFHFLYFIQVVDWRIFQDYICVFFYQSSPWESISYNSKTITKLHDDVIWHQNGFRAIKWFKICYSASKIGTNTSSEIHLEFVFDLNGVLLHLKNTTFNYNVESYRSTLIGTVQTDYYLISTTLPLSIGFPIEICFAIFVFCFIGLIMISIYSFKKRKQ